MIRICSAILPLLLLSYVSIGQEGDKYFYTWVDTTGGYSVEAQFVEEDGETVKLRKRNGNTITIPITKLAPDSIDRALTLGAATKQQATMDSGTKKKVASPDSWIGASGKEFNIDEARARLAEMETPGKTSFWPDVKLLYGMVARGAIVFQPLTVILPDESKKDWVWAAFYVIFQIVGLCTAIWFLVVLFREGVGWGCSYLFPCTTIFALIAFLIMHWKVAWKPFVISVVNTLCYSASFLLAPSWALEAGGLEYQIWISEFVASVK